MKKPWMKFYPNDWRADPALRMCSLAARGLWMEMLAIMHEADPRGSLVVKGNAPTNQQLALLVGSTAEDVEQLLSELESAGVFSRKRSGIIYSRRMETDEIKARKNQENGKKGGNPNIGNHNEKQQGVNPLDKGEVKAQKPEARYQKPDSSSSAREDEPERAPITNQHRVLAANLIDRGKTNLSQWERKFLTDILGRNAITPKMQETLDSIAAKIGFTMTDTMALWTKRLKAARRLQQWDRKWGPAPGIVGCLAPDELLEPADGQGWTEWKATA